MAGVVGVSAGDILAFGRLCRDIYNICFSEARGAHRAWGSLGDQLAMLGHSLDSLYRNTDVLPSDNNEALLSARLVIGDFRETLTDLKNFLENHGTLANPDPSLWKRIKWSTEQGTVEHFRQKISTHIQGITMMLNPIMLHTIRGVDARTSNIQNTVSGIETRIDSISNVLEALLLVAYEQLPHRPSVSRPQMGWHSGGRYLPSSPEHSEDLPFVVRQPTYGSSSLLSPARRLTESPFSPTAQANYESSPPLPSRGDRQVGSNFGTGQPRPGAFGYPTPPSRSYTLESIRSANQSFDPSETPPPPKEAPQDPLRDNPLLHRLAMHAEQSNHGERNRIENWLQAGFWWYFRASSELDSLPDTISKDCYLGLLKSSWIVSSIIRPYDNKLRLPTEIERNVETLSASILQQWRKIEGMQMPDLRNLSPEDFEIWDEEIQIVPQTGAHLRPIPVEISRSALSISNSPTPSRHNSLPDTPSLDRNSPGQDVLPTRWPPALPIKVPARRPVNAQQNPSTATPAAQSPAPDHLSQLDDQQNRSGSREAINSESTSPRSRQSSEAPSFLGGASYSSPHPPTTIVESARNAYNVSPHQGLRIQTSYGEELRAPLEEQLGEEIVLDQLRLSFADRYRGPYTEGSARVLWRPDDGYFRVVTTWEYHGNFRYRSDDVSRLDTELVLEYAYDENLVIFLRSTHQRAPPIDSLNDHPIQSDRDRISPFYKFHAAEDMLNFQATFTKEKVYVDLVRRVSTVTVKKAGTGKHSYGYGRIQLSCDQKPRKSDFSDQASMATGISAGTMADLTLQWSKMVIYFGPSSCFLFCYVTDDITLDVQMERRTVELKPTKHSIFRNPKYVKARIIGSDDLKGGFRLSKRNQSPDDIPNFDDYAYIRILFKEQQYLRVFVDMWEKMIQSRRSERTRIMKLKETLATRRIEANPSN